MRKRFFELAKKASKKSQHPQHRLGCVVTQGSKLVSVGFNDSRTHPKSPHRYNMLHAEIDAIIGIPIQRLNGGEVYVYREKKDGSLGLSKPCATCEIALRNVGIRKVFHTTENGFIGYEI